MWYNKNVENRWIDDSSQRIRCINSYNPPTAIGGLLLFVAYDDISD